MTTTSETGVSVWFKHAGLTIHQGEGHTASATVMARGQRLVVTPGIRAANTGRDGRCVFDLDAAAQERRFGKIMFEVGVPPSDFEVLEVGSFEHDQARANALAEAAQISDPDEQRIALAKVRERYGVASSGRSKTLMEYTR
jgi:hypothetical protein